MTLSTLEVAAFFLATVYLPLADVITYYLACSDLRHRAVGDRAARACRLAALERGADRVLRRADRAAAVGADGELAGDDRARRQPVVCAADADHPLAAGDAGYRAGVVAVRRHLRARRADVAVRLGDAEPRQPRPVRRGRLHLGGRAVVRQPLAEARAGQRGGAVSIFDDRLGGDVRLFRVRRRAGSRRPSSARPSSSAPGSTFSCASSSSGARKRWSTRRCECILVVPAFSRDDD